MPSIKSTILNMFHTTVLLPGITYNFKYRLIVPESFPAETANGLRETLNTMLLQENFPPESSKSTVEITLEMEDSLIVFHCDQVDSAHNKIGNCNIKILRNNFGDAVTDAAWLVFLLTQGMIPMDGATHEIEINVFSMHQQRAASLIYGALQEHFNGNSRDYTQWFVSAAAKATSSFSGKAPRFDRRPVKQGGWKIIEESLAPKLIRKSQHAPAQLISTLYDGDFEEELQQFLNYVTTTPEFLEAEARVIAAAWEKLKHEPYVDLRNTFLTAVEEGNQFYKEKISAISMPTFPGCEYKTLKPEDLSQIFRKLTDAYAKKTGLMLQQVFISECCKKMLQQYEENSPVVMKRLSEEYREILEITDIFEPIEGELLSWEELCNSPETVVIGTMNVKNYADQFITHHLTVHEKTVKWWLSGHPVAENNGTVVPVRNLNNDDILVSVSLD